MTPVHLGMPAPAPPVLRRRISRQVMVGNVPVGGDAPVSVQSMTTTRTADIDATLQQIAAKSQIPVIADIHFQPRYVFAAIDAGSLDPRLLATHGHATPEALVEKVGNQILQSLGLRPRQLEIVSCPSCGRAQVDVYTLAEQVTAAFEGFLVPEAEIVQTLLDEAVARYGSAPTT